MRFIIFVIAWVVGLSTLYALPVLPNLAWLILAFGFSLLVWRYSAFRITKKVGLVLMTSIIGITWGVIDTKIFQSLPESSFNQVMLVEGKVLNLPQQGTSLSGQEKLKFRLAVSNLLPLAQKTAPNTPSPSDLQLIDPIIELSWYAKQLPETLPRAGESWRFAVRLKPNHASINFGAFDYEAYLFANRIAAKGYVVNKAKIAEPINSAVSYSNRQSLHETLQSQWSDLNFKGLFSALIYGEKSQISPDQWQVMQLTGTIHLMAISGLHIGIMAAIGYWLFGWLWHTGVSIRFNPVILVPKMMWGSVGALLFATFYMDLAGYSVPTIRAWFMVLSVLVFLWFRRRFEPVKALALAAFIITLLEPRSVLMQGFWLSFMAVALIFTALFHPRFKPMIRSWPNWQKAVWIQLVLTVGLLPVLAYFYQQVPLYSFLANLVAVPFVSLVALPLLMLSVLINSLSTILGSGLFWLNDQLWQVFWWFLQSFQYLPSGQVSWHLSLWMLVLIYLTLWLWIDGSKRWTQLAFITVFSWLVSSIYLNSEKLTQNTPSPLISVLDVGQGLAIVVETANHTLVYDTGAKWSEKVDGAKLAILPYLRYRQINQVDMLMVSHSDNDHAGGIVSLLKGQKVKQGFSGQAEQLNRIHALKFNSCLAGQKWQWDGVSFEVLAPFVGEPVKSDNDASCVLKISFLQGEENTSVLLTGDISAKQEQRLVQTYGDALQADWLVASHHGSASSSSQAFLAAVAPKQVIFSAGYRNRWQMPALSVVEKVEAIGAKAWNTACSGGLHWKLAAEAKPVQARIEKAHWLHHRCEYNVSPKRLIEVTR